MQVRFTRALLFATLLTLFGGPVWQSVPPTSATTPAVVPSFSYIFEIVLENKEASHVIGNARAPYFIQLVKQFGGLSHTIVFT